MRIAIIGAGAVGSALGLAWLKAGHDVSFGVRNPGDAKYGKLPTERLTEPARAAAGADVIVLATPWEATEGVVTGLGDLSGRILIDCTNPVGMGPDGLELVIGHRISGGEMVAGWATGAHVFKAFNQTGAENMADISRYIPTAAMFVAGDNRMLKPAVLGLVRDLGFAAIDAGPLRIARLLEPLAMLWMDQALYRGAGLDFAFAVVKRG